MIVNTAAYHFTAIAEPQALADAVRERAQALALKGSVLVAPAGMHLFLAGTDADIGAFYDWLRSDARLQAIHVKYSQSRAMPFARLKVKLKPEIISFRREDASPLAAPRAPAAA